MPKEKIIGKEKLDTGTLEFGETDGQGKRFETFTPITGEDLAPAPSIDFKEPEPETIYPVADLETPELKLTEPEKEATAVSDKLQELQTSLVGESAFRAGQEEASGLSEMEQTQTDLSSQLKALQAEAKAIPLQVEQEFAGRASIGAMAGKSRARRRENAIEALTISSLLEASRGNIALAQTQVDRAVAQKYDPIRKEIAVNRANLELILASPEYNLADKNRAEKQLALQNKREKEIAKKEADELEIKNYAVDAANNGADALTLRKIQQAKTPEEALILVNEVKQAKAIKDERIALIQNALNEGFIQIKTTDDLEGLTEDQIFRTIDNQGNEIIFKRPDKGNDFTKNQKLKLEQAGLGEAPRQEQLDYLFGKKGGNASGGGIFGQKSEIEGIDMIAQGYKEGDVLENNGKFYIVGIDGKARKATADEKKQFIAGKQKDNFQEYSKQISNNLIEVVGADGYVSPNDYAAAKSDWIRAGGSPIDFDRKFKNRRNPNNNNYLLEKK